MRMLAKLLQIFAAFSAMVEYVNTVAADPDAFEVSDDNEAIALIATKFAVSAPVAKSVFIFAIERLEAEVL